jgi:hypothetical protein
MPDLKQSTVYNKMFVLKLTGTQTPATGKTPTVVISKNAGTFASPTGVVSEVANGFYNLQLSTTDTNTLGDLAYYITATGCDPNWMTDQVRSVILGDPFTLTSAYDFAKGTTAVSESYAANGAAPTPIQALMAIHQMLMSFVISGTSVSVKKLDNSTAAFSATLDSAVAPTTISRS